MVALYIHWPFCISKCPYCDFNSHVRESVDHAQWESVLLRELNYYGEKTQGQQLQSIFFGGGTPSLMEPRTVESLINAVKSHWSVAPDLEITLEANPGTVDSERFKAFHQSGINRLSMGIQSLHDSSLQFLGRKHSAEEAIAAIEVARDTFPRYSFDLIYARPEQTLEEWEQELVQALDLAGDHLSLYQLTIEQGTAFYTQQSRGDFHIPEDELAADMYLRTDEIMREAGRPAYEVSNYAKPGQESRHNLMYWRYQDYIGIGPGAHGRLTVDNTKVATRGVKAPELWLEQVKGQGHGAAETLQVDQRQQIHEFFLMGLRLVEGVSVSQFEKMFGTEFEKVINIHSLTALKNEGYLGFDGETLKTTLKGRLCLNTVLRNLLS